MTDRADPADEDGREVPATRRRRIQSRLPTDGAFQLMVDGREHEGVTVALLEATDRFPRRGMRLLTAGDGAAVDLLRGHVARRRGLVQEVGAAPPPDRSDQGGVRLAWPRRHPAATAEACLRARRGGYRRPRPGPAWIRDREQGSRPTQEETGP